MVLTSHQTSACSTHTHTWPGVWHRGVKENQWDCTGTVMSKKIPGFAKGKTANFGRLKLFSLFLQRNHFRDFIFFQLLRSFWSDVWPWDLASERCDVVVMISLRAICLYLPPCLFSKAVHQRLKSFEDCATGRLVIFGLCPSISGGSKCLIVKMETLLSLGPGHLDQNLA